MFVKLMAAQAASSSFSRSHQWKISSLATIHTGGHNQQSTGVLSAAQAVWGGVLAMVPPLSCQSMCVHVWLLYITSRWPF